MKFSWEQQVPKAGSVHDAVVNILNGKGLGVHASEQKVLRDAVVNHLLGSVQATTVAYHTQSNQLWNQAILTAKYPSPTGDMLAYLSQSALFLPDKNRADETFGTDNGDREDRAELFGQHM